MTLRQLSKVIRDGMERLSARRHDGIDRCDLLETLHLIEALVAILVGREPFGFDPVGMGM